MPTDKTVKDELNKFLNKMGVGGTIKKAYFLPSDGKDFPMLCLKPVPDAVEVSVTHYQDSNAIVVTPKKTIAQFDKQLAKLEKGAKAQLNGNDLTSKIPTDQDAAQSSSDVQPQRADVDDDDDDNSEDRDTDAKESKVKAQLLKRLKAWQGQNTANPAAKKAIQGFAKAIQKGDWQLASKIMIALEKSAASKPSVDDSADTSTAQTRPKGPSSLQGKTLDGSEDTAGNKRSPLQDQTLRGDEDRQGKRPSPLQGKTLRGEEDGDDNYSAMPGAPAGGDDSDDYSAMPGAPAGGDDSDDYSAMPGAPAGGDDSDDNYSAMPGAPAGGDDTDDYSAMPGAPAGGDDSDDNYSAMPRPPVVDAKVRATHKQGFENILTLFRNIKDQIQDTEKYGKNSKEVANFLKALGNLQQKMKAQDYDVDDVATELRNLLTDVLAMEDAVKKSA